MIEPHPAEIEQTRVEGGDGPWWSRCTETERPGDGYTIYVWDCDPCMIGMIADACREPDTHSVEHDADYSIIREGPLWVTVDRAIAYRERHGLPRLPAGPYSYRHGARQADEPALDDDDVVPGERPPAGRAVDRVVPHRGIMTDDGPPA